MHTPFLLILWQFILPSRYFYHVYRPSPGIVQVRSGAHYGEGKVLAQGTENPAEPGTTVPELIETAWVHLQGRILCPTANGHTVPGQPLMYLTELFGANDPRVGEVWAYAGRRFRDRTTEIPASTVRILERLRDAYGPTIRVQNLQTGRVEEHPVVPFRKLYRPVPEPPTPDH